MIAQPGAPGPLAQLWAALRAGGPEGGWLDRLIGTAVITGMLIAADETTPWRLLGYGGAAVCWLVYLGAVGRVRHLPRLALAAGALAAAATVAGFDPATGAVLLFTIQGSFTGQPANPPSLSLGLVALTSGVVTWSWLETGRPAAGLLLLLGIVAFVTLTGLYRRQFHLRAIETAELLEQTRRAQAEHARAAALDERTRIARELHDVLAHSLGALGVQLEVAEALLEQHDVEGALARLQRSRRLAAEGLDEAHAAVSALRNDVLPLPEALTELAERHRQDHLGATPQVQVSGPARPVPAAVSVSLAGVAREALTNAARHAPGAPLQVALEFGPDAVRLRVHNDAPVRPGQRRVGPPGNGLTGMRERLALIGGHLHAGPDTAVDQGWSVVAEVPT